MPRGNSVAFGEPDCGRIAFSVEQTSVALFFLTYAPENLLMAKAAARRKKTSPQRTTSGCARRRKGTRYWSGRVTEESDALDLRGGVFKLNDPKRIAASLKRSAERSRRRKAEPYRSALSMLVFYINRAGKNLPASRRRTLEKAKVELRRQFGRE
jgi:hypothetical protein